MIHVALPVITEGLNLTSYILNLNLLLNKRKSRSFVKVKGKQDYISLI